jgi:ParB family chromosome partitioning protein
MASAVEAPVQALQSLPLAKIKPSPMNPRKHFDEAKLKELAESIQAHGVRQPIVVRPDGRSDHFEIVVGERRYRASKLAGKAEIPAIVSPMSNAEALEVMVIENLQREDVDPLDEAEGYHALLQKRPEGHGPQHTAESIAAKVGKSVSYIYQRLKLTFLTQDSKDCMRAGHITPGHAILIARLQPLDQDKALRAVLTGHEEPSAEDRKRPIKELLAHEAQNESWMGFRRTMAEKELRLWIQEHVNLNLKNAAWDLGDADLVPLAGACATCPKRSVNNPALFADLVEKSSDDRCFDAECFQKKQKAFVQIKAAQLAEKEKPAIKISEKHSYQKPKEGAKLLRAGQWHEAKAGSCSDVVTGIQVDGEKAGSTHLVCSNPSCKTHRRNFMSSSNGHNSQRDAEARKKIEAAQELDQKVRRALYTAIVAKITIIGDRELRVMAAPGYFREDASELLGWKKGYLSQEALEKKLAALKGAALAKAVFVVLTAEALLEGSYDGDAKERQPLVDLAKAYKLDAAKIERELAAPSQTSAPKKKRGRP